MPYEISRDGNDDAIFHLKTAVATLSEESQDDLVMHLQEALAALGEFAEDEVDPLVANGDLKEFAWSGPIVFENIVTGDNRVFKENSIVWEADTLPWSFRWQKASGQGHAGSVPVGRVDKIERKDDGSIHGQGVVIPGLSDEAGEYLRLLESGAGGGVSVDGDSAQFEVQEMAEGGQPRIEFSSMRLRALSAVDIPAFNGARIKLVALTDGGELAAEAPDLVSEDVGAVDGGELATEVTETVEPGPDVTDSGQEPDPLTLDSAENDAVDVTDQEELSEGLKTDGMHSGWNFDESLVAAAIPVCPSIESFVDPDFDGPTALTVTPDGQVFGHLALFNSCHIGFPGACVKPPKGSNYQYFHTGEIETVEGDLVSTGRLTFGTGHASMTAGPKVAADHYDNTGTVAADVRAGEDKFGIWVVGALRSHLSDEDIRAFRAAPLSGDWRRIAGKLELVGALAVNVPGFPVPRVRALVASGETEALVTFLEEDNENFTESLSWGEEYDQSLSLRIDAKLALAQRLEAFQGDGAGGDKVPTEKIPDDDLPGAPTKKDLEAAAKAFTRADILDNLKLVRELLDDPDETMPAKDRKNIEALYGLFVKTGADGKKTDASGMDVEEFYSSGLELGEYFASGGIDIDAFEASEMQLEEFYNHCHGKGGKFCPTSGDGGITGRHELPGNPHLPGQGGREAGDSGHRHQSPPNKSGGDRGGKNNGQKSQCGQNEYFDKASGTCKPKDRNGKGGGGSPAVKEYQNYQASKKSAKRWFAVGALAYAAQISHVASKLLLPVVGPVVPLLANPAVISIIVVASVLNVIKHISHAKKYKTDFNRSIDKINRDDKAAKRIDTAKRLNQNAGP